MQKDSYFSSIETCEKCGDTFEESEETFEPDYGEGPMHKRCAELQDVEDFDDDLNDELNEGEDRYGYDDDE